MCCSADAPSSGVASTYGPPFPAAGNALPLLQGGQIVHVVVNNERV